MGAIAKTFDRVIPNEIKPIVPVAAAMFGAPYLAGSSLLSGIGSAAVRQGLAGLATNVGTQALMGQKIDPRSAIASGIFSGFGTGLRGLEGTGKLATAGRRVGEILSPVSYDQGTGFGLTGTGEGLSAITQPITLAATTGGTLSAMDAAEEARKEYDATLGEGQEADTEERRNYISRYMSLAGFGQDEIDDALSRYGYSEGGNVTLGEKMSDMKILLMKNDIIESGKLGFDVKDIDTYSDDKIIEIHESIFGQGKKDGGRIGFKIGGSTVTEFMAKLLNAEPSEEVLNRMFEERKKEIFNSMFDPEAGTGAYSMKQMEEADRIAEEQARKELEDYKRRIGMEMENPPEGSTGFEVIEQIMEPRKEGRVEEANGGRIKYAEGGYSPTDYYDSLMYRFYLDDIENEVISPDMSYDDWAQMRSEENAERKAEMAKGGRAGYAEGGGSSSIEQQKRENYFDLKRDEFMSLSEYLLSPMSDSDLRSGKAEGGMMNLKMGGMPAEMDLRGGGFVPIGAKEKADDVPARLSKNEFVFTADAVRAAGGGSVNKGAQKMYDLMNSLEAKV